jgi:FixJ family two-component response regulator
MQAAAFISIVDDDESVRQGIEGLVRAVGYIAQSFKSASDFLESDAARRTSCLIVDMQMPGMTGLELYRRLVASGTPVPTILVTAYPDDRIRAQAFKAGVKSYLGKPFSENELLDAMQSALRHGKSDS